MKHFCRYLSSGRASRFCRFTAAPHKMSVRLTLRYTICERVSHTYISKSRHADLTGRLLSLFAQPSREIPLYFVISARNFARNTWCRAWYHRAASQRDGFLIQRSRTEYKDGAYDERFPRNLARLASQCVIARAASCVSIARHSKIPGKAACLPIEEARSSDITREKMRSHRENIYFFFYAT